MGKILLLAAVDNLAWEDVRPWAVTAKKWVVKDIVVLMYRGNRSLVQNLTNIGIDVVGVEHSPDGGLLEQRHMTQVHFMRWFHIWQYLKECSPTPYDWVIHTDIRDVVFQRDPREFLEAYDAITDRQHKIYFPSEGIRHEDQPWNKQNFIEKFGLVLYNEMQIDSQLVFNSGTMFGAHVPFMKFALQMYMLSQYKGDVTSTGKDQAVANFLWSTLDNTQIVNHSEGWACQSEAAFNSPTGKFLESKPSVSDGVAYTPDGREYVIFHQYDRFPQFKADVLGRITNV